MLKFYKVSDPTVVGKPGLPGGHISRQNLKSYRVLLEPGENRDYEEFFAEIFAMWVQKSVSLESSWENFIKEVLE